MLLKKENGWTKYSDDKKKWAFEFAESYKQFLNEAKTEREFVEKAKILAEKNGFVNAEVQDKFQPGDKIYYINRKKNIVLSVIGKDDIKNGANFVVSHLDSPRLDLKPSPLNEDKEIGLFKTHYYGGIKKYQWVSIPLALHGVVALQNGDTITITIGEDNNDPVFTIPDILPHLSKNVQDDRKSRDVIKGEELKVIIGSMPTKNEDKEIKEKVKCAIMEKLNKDYNIVEEDFGSAELTIVPQGKAKDIGFDRSMVGAYGQDDKVCGYTSLIGVIDIANENSVPDKTAICYLADKEEIGSTGSTGLESRYLEYFMADIIKKLTGGYDGHLLRTALWNSCAISADVNAGLNPVFPSVHDEQNAGKLGYGICVTKYTGSGGKSGSNDADAEYVAKIRKIFNEDNIIWQTAELGKVDEGGGGTVALFLANAGILTIDAGPALLGMHSPFEIASKLDIFETFRAYKKFYKS